jgi:5'-3' exonuclease
MLETYDSDVHGDYFGCAIDWEGIYISFPLLDDTRLLAACEPLDFGY